MDEHNTCIRSMGKQDRREPGEWVNGRDWERWHGHRREEICQPVVFAWGGVHHRRCT